MLVVGQDNVDDDDDEVDGYSSGRRSGDQSESENGGDFGGVWVVGNVEEMEDEEVNDAFSEDGAKQRDEFSNIRADRRDGLSKIRAEQRHGFNKIRDRRDGFSKIHADQGDVFGLYSRRRTCKCQEKTGETKSTSRRDRFLGDRKSRRQRSKRDRDSTRASGDHGGLWSGQECLAESTGRCRENEVEEGGETGGGERKSHSS